MSARFDWPPIAEQKLLDRLALDDQGFAAFTEKIAALIAPREFDASALEHALGYPWTRPRGSFHLRDRDLTILDSLPIGAATPARFPLLSFGSNAAPSRLIAKLEHLPDGQREAIVVTGQLRGFDVGASAHVAVYGALPATIFECPGAAVRAAVLWVTIEQLTALAWTEMSYFFGRLDDIEFAPDIDARSLGSVFLFVSRFGARRVDGELVAMRAIEARGRSTPALTQEALLNQLAREAYGSNATAQDVVSRIFKDFLAATLELRAPLSADAVPFASDRWTRFSN